MDRLPTLSLKVLLLALSACDQNTAAPPPNPEGRFVAVAASKNEASESDFCDVLKPAESAPTFRYPPVDGSARPAAGSWRWINVWASWCGPCVEEMPLIKRLQQDLDTAGAKIDLVYLSVDQTAEAMSRFQKSHPESKGSLRLRDYKALEGWLTSVGLDAGATLPIHLFVDPDGKVRCARTGAVRETDLPFLKKIVL